jgi:hypothetical protein
MVITTSANVMSGSSSDTKPILGVAPGSLYVEIDTGRLWVWNGTAWKSALQGNYASFNQTPADPPAVTVTGGSIFYMVGLGLGSGSTVVAATSNAGQPVITLAGGGAFYAGQQVVIAANTPRAEIQTIASVVGAVMTFVGNLVYTHTQAQADAVVGTGAPAIMPASTGRVRVRIAGDLTGNNAGDTMTVKAVYVSVAASSIPPAGGGASGTVITNAEQVIELTGALTQPFMVEGIIGAAGTTPLTIGVPYVIDLQVTTTTSGKTVQPTRLTCTTEEY